YTAPPTDLTPPNASSGMAVHLNAAGDATVVSPPGFGGTIYLTNIYDPNKKFTQIPNIFAGSDLGASLGPEVLNNNAGAFAAVSTVDGTSVPTAVRPLGLELSAAQGMTVAAELQPCLDDINKFVTSLGPAPAYASPESNAAATYTEAAYR